MLELSKHALEPGDVVHVQGHDPIALEELSALQQEAISFANSLMCPEPSKRPTAAAAFAHPFLSPQSMTQAEADMRRCLPAYSHQKHILPVLSERSWSIGALHSAASVQPDGCVQLSVPVSTLPAANMPSLHEIRCNLPAKRKAADEPSDCSRSGPSSAASSVASAAAWSGGVADAVMGFQGHEQYGEVTCKHCSLATAPDESVISAAPPAGHPIAPR